MCPHKMRQMELLRQCADDKLFWGHCHPGQTVFSRGSPTVILRRHQLLAVNACKTEVVSLLLTYIRTLFQACRHLLQPDPVSTICPLTQGLAGFMLPHNLMTINRFNCN